MLEWKCKYFTLSKRTTVTILRERTMIALIETVYGEPVYSILLDDKKESWKFIRVIWKDLYSAKREWQWPLWSTSSFVFTDSFSHIYLLVEFTRFSFVIILLLAAFTSLIFIRKLRGNLHSNSKWILVLSMKECCSRGSIFIGL